MTTEELIELFNNNEQIGLTIEQLQIASDSVLASYVRDMNFYKIISEEDLDIILPENDFVGEVALKDCVTPIIIDEDLYVRIGIYKHNRRTYPTSDMEFKLWLTTLGTDNIYKELPNML